MKPFFVSQQLTRNLIALSFFVLLSCSSMEIDGDDIYDDQLPDDFSWSDFAAVNTDVVLLQSLDTIKTLNTEWEQAKKDDGLSTAEINVLKNADKEEFFAVLDAAGPVIAKEFLGWSDDLVDVMMKQPLTGSYKKYLADGAKLSSMQGASETGYNIFGRTDEVDFIKSLPKDSVIFTQTYVLYGRTDGRAYRACGQSEIKEENIRTISMAVNVGTANRPSYDYSEYLFCADTNNGRPYIIYKIP